MTKLFERNTIILAKKDQIFIIYADNLPGILIQVFEVERAMRKIIVLATNSILMEFHQRHVVISQMEATFDIDANGILKKGACAEKLVAPHGMPARQNRKRALAMSRPTGSFVRVSADLRVARSRVLGSWRASVSDISDQ